MAYLQMNETEVPQYPLVDWLPTHAQVEAQRYPQPGDPNPNVRVGVVSAVRRQDGVGEAAHSGRPGLHSALWLGRSPHRCGSRP